MDQVNQAAQTIAQAYPECTENVQKQNESDLKGEIPFIKSNYQYFGGISILYGILFALCLYRNVMSVMFPLLVVGTLMGCCFYLKKFRLPFKKTSVFYLASSVLLGISFVFTTSGFQGFFTVMGIMLLISVFMVQQCYEDKEWRFFYYIRNLVHVSGYTLACFVMPFRHMISFVNHAGKGKYKYLTSVLWGLLISVPLVGIVVVLLLNADQVFHIILNKTILNFLSAENIFLTVLLLLTGYIGCYSFFCSLSLKNLPEQKPAQDKSIDAVIAITFTSILTLVYVLFCVIQVIYLFSGGIGELPQEVTYAMYARKGFFELLFVSLLNIFLVLFCSIKFKNNKALKVLLALISFCTYILLASSMYRMILYIKVYHLTFLRVLVLWFLGLLAFLLTGLIVFIFHKKFRYFKYSVVIITVFYILLSFSRPDAVIAEYNINNFDKFTREDINYLMELSLDAAPAIAKIDPDKVTVSSYEKYYAYDALADIKMSLEQYFRIIRTEESGKSIRQFNLSRQKALQAADQYLGKYAEIE